jgi:hypothetical protein
VCRGLYCDLGYGYVVDDAVSIRTPNLHYNNERNFLHVVLELAMMIEWELEEHAHLQAAGNEAVAGKRVAVLPAV